MRWIVRCCRALVAPAVFSVLVTGLAAAQGVTTGAIAGKVTDPQGQPVAQGLSEYGSTEVGLIKGRRSEEHQALLGYAPRSAVIHRDQLVLL